MTTLLNGLLGGLVVGLVTGVALQLLEDEPSRRTGVEGRRVPRFDLLVAVTADGWLDVERERRIE